MAGRTNRVDPVKALDASVVARAAQAPGRWWLAAEVPRVALGWQLMASATPLLPTTASGDSGEVGLVTFRTDATPDEVVAFYERRAVAAGMRPVMGMSQGDARAFGASAGETEGAKLQVVAAPDEAGATSVQLSWSSGG